MTAVFAAYLGSLTESLVQLRSSPLRTMLTLLGVVFGVGSVVAMVSIGEGAQRKILASIEAMGATSLHVRSSATKPDNLADLVNVSVGLSRSDAESLARSLAPSKDAKGHTEDRGDAGSMGKAGVAYRATYSPKVSSLPVPATDLRVIGVTATLFDAANLHMAEGRRLGSWDEHEATPYCVIGVDLAQENFPNGAIGEWIRVDYAWLQVVGVLAHHERSPSETDRDASIDRSIVVTFDTLREMLEPARAYGDLDGISIQLASIEDTRPGKIIADRLLANLHGGASDFEVVSPDEVLRQRRETQYVMTAVLTAIAAISLLVGGIGVMNIMLANVSERVTEIGLRRAIGGTRGDVLAQFLLEAVVICVVGGAIGALFGAAAAVAAAYVMELPVVLSWEALVLAFIISVFVGVTSGFIPARRAANLDPIEALRGE